MYYLSTELWTTMCCENIYREIGTIIRSLGCCPSEAELHDMLAEVNHAKLFASEIPDIICTLSDYC